MIIYLIGPSGVGKTSCARRASEVLAARQMTIVPGFIDCHNQAPGNTLLYDTIAGQTQELVLKLDFHIAQAQQAPITKPVTMPVGSATAGAACRWLATLREPITSQAALTSCWGPLAFGRP